MAIQSFGSKQSYEEYFVTFDFFRLISSDEILSAAVVVTDSTGAVVTDTLTEAVKQSISGSQVNVFVKAGTSGSTYKITCKIVTETTEQYEMEAYLPVLDI